MATTPTLDQISSLAKRRGFVYPTSEIYGGLANSYDYGPLGAQLLKNIRDAWWKEFIDTREDMVGLDSQIMLHPTTWKASGHIDSFVDPLVTDTKSGKRYRADHVIEQWVKDHPSDTPIVVEDMTIEDMGEFISTHKVVSPEGNQVDQPRAFNILFESEIGAVTGNKAKVYFRGETAQGIFTNFKQILDSTRIQLPFGVGQIGKSFRNEITTGQFIFRTLELEQAEIEYFFDPETTNWQELFDAWKDHMWHFVTRSLAIDENNLKWRRHTDKERSHYSKETFDLDYRFPFGFKELWGIAYRTDYDLKMHMQFSGQSLEYTNPFTGNKFIPHVIEPALGIGRVFLMLLTDAYWVDKVNGRIVLKLKPSLAPYKVAVFPLLKNKPELVQKARKVFDLLKPKFTCSWDDRGNIGKRYLYQDEIGTPFCITIDFDTLKDDSVTVRFRDTAKQERVNIENLEAFIQQELNQ